MANFNSIEHLFQNIKVFHTSNNNKRIWNAKWDYHAVKAAILNEKIEECSYEHSFINEFRVRVEPYQYYYSMKDLLLADPISLPWELRELRYSLEEYFIDSREEEYPL